MFYLLITQGVLSAIGVLIARGHKFSALTAFGLAWYSFLNPFLAIGWLAGLVEIRFGASSKDTTFKRILRIILVIGRANLGSMVRTFVAMPIMVHYFDIANPLDIIRMALSN